MTLKHKAFIQALKFVRENPKKAKNYLNDKRMTNQEKVIFLSFLQVRDSNNQDVVDSLLRFTCSDVFVESQRHFGLGAAYNNLTNYAQSEFHLKESIRLNTYKDGADLKFAACHSLFIVCLNTFKLSGMEEAIQKMQEIETKSEKFNATLLYCEFSLAVQKQQIDLAKKLILKVEDNFAHLNEHQSLDYLLDYFDLFLMEDNYDQCMDAIERIKRLRKFKNESNLKYMQAMLGFIRDDAPIYLYEKDFQSYPFMCNQVMCIKALENGNEAAAREAWAYLHKTVPQSYQAPFEYIGPTNLFSKALSKFKLQVKPLSIPLSFESNLTKEEKLIQLLGNANTPIQKEAIYKLIWDKELESKDDLKKLVKVVQRARDRFDVDIKSIKGSYLIKDKKAG